VQVISEKQHQTGKQRKQQNPPVNWLSFDHQLSLHPDFLPENISLITGASIVPPRPICFPSRTCA
jgi:hypothetical protein